MIAQSTPAWVTRARCLGSHSVRSRAIHSNRKGPASRCQSSERREHTCQTKRGRVRMHWLSRARLVIGLDMISVVSGWVHLLRKHTCERKPGSERRTHCIRYGRLPGLWQPCSSPAPRFVDVSNGASSPADSRLSFMMLRFLAAFAALFALSSATSLAATVRVSGAL